MDLKTAALRTVSGSLTATAALAIVAGPAHAQDYVVQPGDTVSAIALGHGVTVDTIVSGNGLNSRATIYAGQRLTIPDTATTLSANHVVAKGDTLWGIAATYRTTVSHIQRANRMSASTLIRIGETLSVPGGTSTPSTRAAASSTQYTVRSGDTLWSIAARSGTSVAALAQINGLTNPSLIRVNQSLTIPAGAVAAPSATSASAGAATTSAPSTYVVVSGDTVSSIAGRFGTTVAAIASANGLANPSFIRADQRLMIPGGTPTGLVGDTFLGRTYAAEVVAAANVNKANLNAMTVPTRVQMQQLVISTANDMGVSPALAQAIAYQESGFNMRAVSPANAIGCMQVIPSSGDWASDLVGRDLDLLNPQDNVAAGVAILKQLQRNGAPLETAIAGYYQGERSVRERGMNKDTVAYVASVISLMDRFD